MADTADALVVLINARPAGRLERARQGGLTFAYDETWQSDPDATPLSLSMPLRARRHDGPAVEAFLWGLLPDNDRVVERWARTFQVSAANPFALLRHVGEDCAGAAQFVVPERVDQIIAGAGAVDWLDDSEIAARLRMLRNDPTAWHGSPTGQFSLAGAQAKTALYFDAEDSRWGAPSGAVPTTHILKPAVTGYDNHDLNEHLCLETARRAGLPAARSAIAAFDDERAIVVERYDRQPTTAGIVVRVHQEDVCQALGVPPVMKYQNEGGPGPSEVVELLRAVVAPSDRAASDVATFVDALALNWILGGTDAHAKNYSLLLAGGQARLAPLYDVASALPYDMYVPKLKMAMRIGGEYRLAGIGARHWRRLAGEIGLETDRLFGRLHDLLAVVPECLAAAASDETVESLDSDLPERLHQLVVRRVEDCAKALA